MRGEATVYLWDEVKVDDAPIFAKYDCRVK